MLEQQQHIVCQAAGNAILGELPLPRKSLRIGHNACLNDLECCHAAPVPLPASPFPRIAQRVASMPYSMFSRSQTIMPRSPKNRSSGAVRNPIKIEPTSASMAISPCCQILSNRQLQYHPHVATTPSPDKSPATSK